MTTMTDVAVPTPSDGVSANWTLVYTAAAGVTILLQNRTPHTDMRIRVNGSAGTTGDALTAPYQTLRAQQAAKLPR